MKRIVCALLILCLTLMLLPASAFAAQTTASGNCGEVKSGNDGKYYMQDNVKWSLDSNGVLTISGTGAMNGFATDTKGSADGSTSKSMYAPWKAYRGLIKEIIIGEGVTSIGSNAFYNMPVCTKVTLPSTVTAIGMQAFYNAPNILKISLPDGLKTINALAFYGCSNLSGISFPEGLSVIGDNAFESCTSITEVVLPFSLTSLGASAFEGCSKLSSITFLSAFTTIRNGGTATPTIPTKTIIYGYPVSTAKLYADNNGLTFIPIYDENDPSIVVNTPHAPAGSKVEVLVALENFSDVDTLGIELDFDRTAIQFIPDESHWLVGDTIVDSIFGSFDEFGRGTMANESIFDPNTVIAKLVFKVNEATLVNETSVTYRVVAKLNENIVSDITKIGKISIGDYIKGDLDNNRIIDRDDALYLLYASVFGTDVYPTNQNCDFKKDNVIDKDDAIYLLYHSIFGNEQYPI